jgi:hypothetical protein
MIRLAASALIALSVGVVGAAASPSEAQSEMAPMQGEAQAAPKAVTQPAGPSAEAPSESRTSGLASNPQPKARPAAAAESPSSPPVPPPMAQDRAASTGEQRFSFHRAKDGFLRLDSQTGQIAQCGWGATGWACSAVPDERAALENEIARLQGENGELKKFLLSHGLPLPAGVKPDASPRRDEAHPKRQPELIPPSKAPSEADLDRAIAFVRDVWRRLVELIVDLQRDIQRKS